MTTINWKRVAPKRADWERLTRLAVGKGLPPPHWLNGIPSGLTEGQLAVLQQLAQERAPTDPTEGLSSFPPKLAAKAPAKTKKPGKAKAKR